MSLHCYDCLAMYELQLSLCFRSVEHFEFLLHWSLIDVATNSVLAQQLQRMRVDLLFCEATSCNGNQ